MWINANVIRAQLTNTEWKVHRSGVPNKTVKRMMKNKQQNWEVMLYTVAALKGKQKEKKGYWEHDHYDQRHDAKRCKCL